MMMRQGGATATRVGMINTALKAAANYKWVAAVYGGGVRNGSTFALSEKENHSEKKVESDSSSSSSHSAAGGNKDEKGVMSYWGIQPNKITKEDGSEWKWNCFRVCLFSSSLDLFFLFSLCFFFLRKINGHMILVYTQKPPYKVLNCGMQPRLLWQYRGI